MLFFFCLHIRIVPVFLFLVACLSLKLWNLYSRANQCSCWYVSDPASYVHSPKAKGLNWDFITSCTYVQTRVKLKV